jgi:crotonobetainyl-CoA:carnitine CoA-transferase CaiB-like acyl-CoA transferase
MFLMLNRGKRSLALNLRSAAGQQVLQRLAAQADAFVEGFRPGVAARLGAGWDALSALNPRLVYCSISGFGQDGPLAQAAGHDINYQSLAGVLDQMGLRDGQPSPGNFQAADLAGGALSGAMAILAALVDAQRTGKGRRLDISMTDCLMALNVIPAAYLQEAGRAPPRGGDFLSGGIAAYGTYETADGRWLAVGAVEHKFWTNFCNVIGRPDLVKRGHAYGEVAERARAEVAAVVRGRTLAEWTAAFAGVDACVTPVLTLDEAIAHENARARGMVVDAEHPTAGRYWRYASPVGMSEDTRVVPSHAPCLGADNLPLLRELGYGPADIEQLDSAGAFRA